MGFFSSRRYLALLAVVGLAVTGGGLYAAKKAADVEITDTGALFKVHCRVTHTLMDDPIVFPDRPGISHLHNFFGNMATDAYSDTASFSQASSSCANDVNQIDHSSYWFPALLRNNVPIPTDGDYINAYYRAGRGQQPIQPFPYGLRMIAGDSMAADPQLPRVVTYGCAPTNDDAKLGSSPEIPNCPPGRYPAGTVTFPSCWDGVHLDSTDHRSHMTYPAPDSGCPDDYPVRVPQLVLRIGWAAAEGMDASELALASGGQYSLHADFWNVWAPGALSQLVTNCLGTPTDCSGGVRARVTGDVVFPQAEWTPEES